MKVDRRNVSEIPGNIAADNADVEKIVLATRTWNGMFPVDDADKLRDG